MRLTGKTLPQLILTAAIGFTFFFSECLAQSGAKIDSLLVLIGKDKNDTGKVNHLNALGWEFKGINPDTSLILANEALAIAENISWKKGIASSLGSIGVYYRLKADYPKALDYLLRALKIDEELEDRTGIATRLGNIGSVYWNQTDYDKALDFYLQALQMNKALGDKQRMATNMGNLGSVYFNRAMVSRQKGDTIQANLDYPKTLEYYLKGLVMAEEIGDKQLQSTILGNIGNVYKYKGDYTKALDYSLEALKLSEEIENKGNIGYHNGSIGSLYAEFPFLPSPPGETDKGYLLAAKYLFRALAVSKEMGAMENERNWYEQLSLLYEKSDVPLPDSAGGKLLSKEEMRIRAIYFYKRSRDLQDIIFSEENKREFVHKEMIYNFEKKEALAEASQKRQMLILILVSSVLILVFAFALVFYRSLRITRSQKAVIEKQNLLVEKSNHEKDVLLKEIHHRVKNNLQIITSLLNLQTNSITDPGTLEVLRQAHVRVRSMALVHQKLYQAANFSKIDFGEYLQDLSSYIGEMFHENPHKITCTISTTEKRFNIDTAIPLGLILTELLSNSYKYAFQGKEEGNITISIFRADNSKFLLVYTDNGVGLPLPVPVKESKTLGLELVGMLAEQLQGSVNMFNKEGANFEIYFQTVTTPR
jgi:two-component system, sensor histidine kinase PdtaS